MHPQIKVYSTTRFETQQQTDCIFSAAINSIKIEACHSISKPDKQWAEIKEGDKQCPLTKTDSRTERIDQGQNRSNTNRGTDVIAAVQQCAISSIDELLPLPKQAPENNHGK